jgi:hypothetical protein
MSNSNSEYPEDRPKDQNGVPVRTPHQAEQDKIREPQLRIRVEGIPKEARI